MSLGRAGTAVFVCLAACAGGSFDKSDWQFKKPGITYKTGALPASWKKISIEDGDLAFRDARGGTIFANAMCGDRQIEDEPLSVLANDLLLGIKPYAEQSRQTLSLAGREALRLRVLGQLDGVEVALDLVVLKKNGCTVDLQLVAGPKEIETSAADFQRFVDGFVLEQP